MGKSTRSKWKKMHKRLRAVDEADNVAARIEGLNDKLDLAVQGGLSKVPMQAPETRFHFAAPQLEDVARKKGERLFLQPLKTNPKGKSDPAAPHPQTFTFDTVAAAAPIAGCAISVADVNRMQAASVVSFQQAFQAAMQKARQGGSGGADDDDGPVEITIGCNDDAYINESVPRGSKGGKKGAAVVKSTSSSAPLALPAGKKGAKKELNDAPKVKIASMALKRTETAGGAKMKTGAPKARIVSGTASGKGKK